MLFLLVDLPFGELEMFNDTIAVSLLIAALIFVIAAGTDWLDGYYARKLNLITSFGKFIDPLADKLLVTAALIGWWRFNLFQLGLRLLLLVENLL